MVAEEVVAKIWIFWAYRQSHRGTTTHMWHLQQQQQQQQQAECKRIREEHQQEQQEGMSTRGQQISIG
eukprot:3823610-Ditylum_brightwellii.AAC.1